MHLALSLATADHLPPNVGQSAMPIAYFFIGWFCIIGCANLAFIILRARMPHLKDRWLAVPNRAYWLSSEARRQVLVDRLQGICEIALLGLNVFFMAVYQAIYQSNAHQPVIAVPMAVLVFFFMVVPVLAIGVAVLIYLRALAQGSSPE